MQINMKIQAVALTDIMQSYFAAQIQQDSNL